MWISGLTDCFIGEIGSWVLVERPLWIEIEFWGKEGEVGNERVVPNLSSGRWG